MTLVQITSIKQANEIVGGLSTPSKMPGYSISISAEKCKTGGKLRKVKGSVCENCYACKGRYVFPQTKEAHRRRAKSLYGPAWVSAMVYLINERAEINNVFRWHDSGDIQSLRHLTNIVSVIKQTPTVKHWLPTKERKIIAAFLKKNKTFPDNLCVRISMPMVGQKPKLYKTLTTSTVNSGKGFICPVQNGSQTCDQFKCRACWDREVKNIDYRSH